MKATPTLEDLYQAALNVECKADTSRMLRYIQELIQRDKIKTEYPPLRDEHGAFEAKQILSKRYWRSVSTINNILYCY